MPEIKFLNPDRPAAHVVDNGSGRASSGFVPGQASPTHAHLYLWTILASLSHNRPQEPENHIKEPKVSRNYTMVQKNAQIMQLDLRCTKNFMKMRLNTDLYATKNQLIISFISLSCQSIFSFFRRLLISKEFPKKKSSYLFIVLKSLLINSKHFFKKGSIFFCSNFFFFSVLFLLRSLLIPKIHLIHSNFSALCFNFFENLFFKNLFLWIYFLSYLLYKYFF